LGVSPAVSACTLAKNSYVRRTPMPARTEKRRRGGKLHQRGGGRGISSYEGTPQPAVKFATRSARAALDGRRIEDRGYLAWETGTPSSSSAADRACVARSPATYGSFDHVPDASKPKNNSGRCRLESKSMTAIRIRPEAQGSVSLCSSCHWAHIQHGFAESEEAVLCRFYARRE